MASTYSPALRLELMATGDQSGTWGDTTNTNLGTLLEQAITGYLSVAQGDVANLTLTTTDGASDQARNAVVEITGALTATRNVVVQTAEKLYTIKNSTTGGFSIVAKTTAGTGISIPPGASIDCYSDGTNVVAAANYWNGQIGGAVYLDAGATVGPAMDLFRDSTSPAASDVMGQVVFNGRDSAGNKQEYASIEATILDTTSTSEDGTLDLYATVAGTRTKLMSVFGTGVGIADGTVSLPGLSFISDPNTGMYRIGADNIGVAANGAKVLDIATTGLAVTGTASVSSTAAGILQTLISTDAGASVGPTLDLYRDSASPATNDSIGSIQFNGRDSAGNKQQYAEIASAILDATSTSEDGYLAMAITAGGTPQGQFYLGLTAAAAADPNNVGLPKGQLSFPATQNPSSNVNTLDDFEEGQTTPTITASSGTFTTVSCTLNYTKIGRAVTFTATITITTAGTAAGFIDMPVPFAAVGVGSVSGVEGAATAAAVNGLITNGSSSMQIYKYDGTTIIASGRTLYLSGLYMAAT